MGFISIFYFCSLLRPLFFMIVVAVSLSFGFLRCKGMAVLSDTKHQAMPYSAKTFPECLPQMLHIWVFQKTFYRIVWCSDSWNHHFLMHVKRLYDDEMTESFPECLPQMLHIWVFQKTFYRIVWCSDSWNHHFLMHVKRLYDDEMTE